MKKIVLLVNVLIFSSIGLFSQSISLSNADGPIANNQVIWVSGDANIPLAAYIYVTNNTSSDLEVLVRKEEILIIPGSTNYFCWLQCYPSSVFVSPDPLVIPANSTNTTNFSGDYDAGGIFGISRIRYTFFKNHLNSDSATVTVWFNAGYVGLGEQLPYGISFSPAYPNPASSSVRFSYELPANLNKSVSVSLSNLIGEKVNESLITDQQGIIEIPVNQLHAGIYFYSINVNGQAVITRKLVVK